MNTSRGFSLTLSSELLCLVSNMFKADDLGKDIVMIALPAVLALAADPIASLVDTAFIGQIGEFNSGVRVVKLEIREKK